MGHHASRCDVGERGIGCANCLKQGIRESVHLAMWGVPCKTKGSQEAGK